MHFLLPSDVQQQRPVRGAKCWGRQDEAMLISSDKEFVDKLSQACPTLLQPHKVHGHAKQAHQQVFLRC